MCIRDRGSIKSKITESVKEEYLAGSDRDREKLEKKLLALEDAEGKPLYEEDVYKRQGHGQPADGKRKRRSPQDRERGGKAGGSVFDFEG